MQPILHRVLELCLFLLIQQSQNEHARRIIELSIEDALNEMQVEILQGCLQRLGIQTFSSPYDEENQNNTDEDQDGSAEQNDVNPEATTEDILSHINTSPERASNTTVKGELSLRLTRLDEDKIPTANSKWVEERLRELENTKIILMSEVDKLNSKLLDKEQVIISIKEESEKNLGENKKLSELIVEYEIKETERKGLIREIETLKEEMQWVTQEYKRKLQEKDEEIEALREQVLRKSALEGKVKELESKLSHSKEIALELESTKLNLKSLEQKNRDTHA
jgi:hypothetical protein